eukprot:scaffold28334_cov63-Phaeocystis_antarctica.AAC.1
MPVILPARCGSTLCTSGKSRSPSSCFCSSAGAAAGVAAPMSCGALSACDDARSTSSASSFRLISSCAVWSRTHMRRRLQLGLQARAAGYRLIERALQLDMRWELCADIDVPVEVEVVLCGRAGRRHRGLRAGRETSGRARPASERAARRATKLLGGGTSRGKPRGGINKGRDWRPTCPPDTQTGCRRLLRVDVPAPADSTAGLYPVIPVGSQSDISIELYYCTP